MAAAAAAGTAASAAAAGGGASGGGAAAPDPRDCDVNLLVLDPSAAASGLTHALAPGMRGGGWERMIKRGLHTLVKPAYQLVVIDPTRAVVSAAEARRTLRELDEERHLTFL